MNKRAAEQVLRKVIKENETAKLFRDKTYKAVGKAYPRKDVFPSEEELYEDSCGPTPCDLAWFIASEVSSALEGRMTLEDCHKAAIKILRDARKDILTIINSLEGE